jgi:hypothetical protein
MQDSCALKAVEFSKYRVFEQRQRLELKPLTLLFGHNSAGKSAALRLLPILAAAAQRQRRNANLAVLDYSSPALREALFQDLIYNGQVAGGLQFGLCWSDVTYDVTLRDLGAGGEVIGNFNVTVEAKTYSGGPSESEAAIISKSRSTARSRIGSSPDSAPTLPTRKQAKKLLRRCASVSITSHPRFGGSEPYVLPCRGCLKCGRVLMERSIGRLRSCGGYPHQRGGRRRSSGGGIEMAREELSVLAEIRRK